ncbi:Plus3 domain-containing protein [Abeliophyllum distichum]|uniref:Plus3 domain-containing protein n=1 Tax=Abeliophyllum distichum TaxID=126358 RepID=A0ABD1URA6_9LAMI
MHSCVHSDVPLHLSSYDVLGIGPTWKEWKRFELNHSSRDIQLSVWTTTELGHCFTWHQVVPTVLYWSKRKMAYDVAGSSPQAKISVETVSGTRGRREVEVESGLSMAPVWKCKFFPSEVNEKQLREWHQAYRAPDEIEFIVPGPNDRADDPLLGCVALNQAVLAVGLRLPFSRIVRKFLREWRIAPIQLCPNGWRIMIGFFILWEQLGFPRPSVREFNSLYFFKSDAKRSGWWYASVKAKTGGYTSQEPTVESSERAQRARGVSEGLRSSSVLITEENLISARLSLSSSTYPRDRQSREEMKDISVHLRKKTQTQVGKGKRKAPAWDQDRSARPRVEPELPPQPAQSPTRSVEEITMTVPVQVGPSSSQTVRPQAVRPQLQPTYLGSTSDKDEEFVQLRGTLPKLVRDFIRSNSLTREEITGLPLSIRRAIRTVAKCWTPT